MISKKQFILMDSDQKANWLISVFSQLSQKDGNLSDILDLLDSGFSFQENVLEHIYDMIYEVISTGKSENQESISRNLVNIHKLLEDEAKQSSNEADNMLIDM